MAISKITLNGVTQMDVTGKTVTSGTMLSGTTALKNDGTDITGNIQTKTSSDLTVNGATVTAPAGYYSSAASKTIPDMEYEAHNSFSFRTQSGQRKCDIEAWSTVEVPGYIGGGTIVAMDDTYNAVAANTTITPTTSSQTVGGANWIMEGALTVAAMPSGTAGTPTASKGTVSNHAISVTPSVTNTTGYITGGTKTGTAVSVSASELVSGTKSISANGTGIDVTNYASVNVAVPSGSPNLQAKTNISPTTSSQTIRPDTGYDGLSSVQINAMPNGSATTPATTITANPSISVSSGGLITATTSATKAVTPTVSAGYVSSGTSGTITVSGSNTSQLSTQAAQTIYPSTEEQSITAGVYLTGNQTIAPVTTTNLNANNILRGVTVEVGDASDSDRVASVQGVLDVDVVVDPTLSNAGEAADAEVTGDKLHDAITMEYYNTTTITNNTNYNNLTTPGNYSVISSAAAATMTNCPAAYAHRLFVFTSTATSRLYQVVMENTTPVNIFMRYNSGSWGAWTQVINVAPPTSNGTYTLQCTVTSGKPAYSWVTT